jgi:hypothetical protein
MVESRAGAKKPIDESLHLRKNVTIAHLLKDVRKNILIDYIYYHAST